MAVLVRFALGWAAVLATCQIGLAQTEDGSWETCPCEGSPCATASHRPCLDCSACWGEYCGYGPAGGHGFLDALWSDGPCEPVPQIWTIDYRARSLLDSDTSYEFGTPPGYSAGDFAPLSKLEFDLDSNWHGLQIGVELPDWHFHFEWLMPIGDHIDGQMADFDWNITPPTDDPTRLDSFTLHSERWRDGQMLELGTEMKLTDTFFGWPVEFWPTGGFRFQRLSISAYGANVVVPNLGWLPEYDGVDIITFNQQYYVGYFGGQLRKTTFVGRVPVDMTFQVDGGPVAGYNIDHHLVREGDRYTMEKTQGGMWHVGFLAEAHLTARFSLGFQADHTQIRTTGTHRYYNEPYSGQYYSGDFTWDNGVIVESTQTTLTAFLRYRF